MPQNARLGRNERKQLAGTFQLRQQQESSMCNMAMVAMANGSQATAAISAIVATSTAAAASSQATIAALAMQSLMHGRSTVAGPDYGGDLESSSDEEPFYPGCTLAPKARPPPPPKLAGVLGYRRRPKSTSASAMSQGTATSTGQF